MPKVHEQVEQFVKQGWDHHLTSNFTVESIRLTPQREFKDCVAWRWAPGHSRFPFETLHESYVVWDTSQVRRLTFAVDC